jgi:photosystem II stability/assembly factor-like uncharacterized protein
MKKTLVLLTILLWCGKVNAQWREIADFQTKDDLGNTFGEYITCAYFLDLPGSSRIGFVGASSELYKTIDGGLSWSSVWSNPHYPAYITDICFKDSLTGWFIFSGVGVYRTQDGGETWNLLEKSSIANNLYFCHASNRLLLSTDSNIYASTDLGDVWTPVSSVPVLGFSFSNDSIGIAAAFPPNDTTHGIIRTSDGGLTWNLIVSQAFNLQPLAIPGTSICFAANEGDPIIYRSDDCGLTWRTLKDFGTHFDTFFQVEGPYCTGYIKGDLSRLFIQTDSGMYFSIDSGYTWNLDPGSPAQTSTSPNDIFYSAHGVTIAGMTYDDSGVLTGGGLWEEDWPQAGVSESDTSILSNATANPNPTGEGTIISFGISKETYVKIELFDVLGHEVKLVKE